MRSINKNIYILGINGSHNAAAALLKNGEIIAYAQEERFTREKNQRGYPQYAIAYCLKFAGILSQELTSVVVGFEDPTLFIHAKEYKKNVSIAFLKKYLLSIDSLLHAILPQYQGFNLFYTKHRSAFSFLGFEKQQQAFLARKLKVSPNSIFTMDHHTAHAYAAYYANPDYETFAKRPCLAITCDGTGDHVSSKVFVVEKDEWTEIAATPDDYSLGWLYATVTSYLGMKINEHEQKVMGLAPYAQKNAARRLYQVLKKHFWVDRLTIQSDIPLMHYDKFIEKVCKGIRFDIIAQAVQKLTEDLLTTLVTNASKHTGIKQLVLGGGVFMNVKANQAIAKLPSVQKIFPMPSSGDESTAIGAAYYGYKTFCKKTNTNFSPKPLKTLYLGPSFTAPEIEKLVNSFTKRHTQISVEKLRDPASEIAKLLANGQIVAHFAGRMEYGARSLGNRSILADPANQEVIHTINDQIKGRDFWMPFAPVILQERAHDYLINPKNIASPFMMFTFDTTQLAKKHLKACLHPYDYTARAQMLSSAQNSRLYSIIQAFEKLTGIGALLNTSFNLHGEPIICTPHDSLDCFIRSNIQYLVLENLLLKKNVS